jgi:purine-binding chemotaxis protein CheW
VSQGREAIVPRRTDALKKSEADAGVRELLGFELGPDHYALPLSCVREIVRVPAVTEVPRGPEDVLGVISVRGAVTTLVDLRRRLRLPQQEFSGKTRVLLVDRGDEVMGLLVDGVLQVYRLRPDEIELATVLGAEAPAYLAGIGRPGAGAHDGRRAAQRDADPGEVILLLDPTALLRM